MKAYTPERNDIIWLDFEPTKAKEIGKYRPALVLSSKDYNQATGLIICCPIYTSVRGGLTEVPITNLDQPSVVAANLIQRTGATSDIWVVHAFKKKSKTGIKTPKQEIDTLKTR